MQKCIVKKVKHKKVDLESNEVFSSFLCKRSDLYLTVGWENLLSRINQNPIKNLKTLGFLIGSFLLRLDH